MTKDLIASLPIGHSSLTNPVTGGLLGLISSSRCRALRQTGGRSGGEEMVVSRSQNNLKPEKTEGGPEEKHSSLLHFDILWETIICILKSSPALCGIMILNNYRDVPMVCKFLQLTILILSCNLLKQKNDYLSISSSFSSFVCFFVDVCLESASPHEKKPLCVIQTGDEMLQIWRSDNNSREATDQAAVMSLERQCGTNTSFSSQAPAFPINHTW